MNMLFTHAYVCMYRKITNYRMEMGYAIACVPVNQHKT